MEFYYQKQSNSRGKNNIGLRSQNKTCLDSSDVVPDVLIIGAVTATTEIFVGNVVNVILNKE